MDISNRNFKNNATHLVVIIDVTPDSQILKKDLINKTPAYLNWINSITAFCNSHLLLNHLNQLTVIVSNFDVNTIVFPIKKKNTDKNQKQLNGQYEVFSDVLNGIQTTIKEIVSNSKKIFENNVSQKNFHSLIAGAIGIALCRIHRLESEFDDSRICIITSTCESSILFSSQYMNFMNTFFSAQKKGIAIDVCVVDESNKSLSSSILQQASDLTNGIYLKINNSSAVLEYLLWVFLTSVETRKKLILPIKPKISYRASCFCHRNQIDIGYVCSVCLTVFCSFNPICTTCQTVFKLGPEPNGIKVKKRKV